MPRDDSRRLRDFLEIMTVETPDDPFHKQLRARLFQRIIHRIEIDDSGTGPITIMLFGHLVPETAPVDASNPVHACHDLLDAYATRKAREMRGVEGAHEARTTTETAMAKGNRMAVWGEMYSQLLDLPSAESQELQRKMALESIAWRQRISHARKQSGAVPSWTLAFVVTAPERPVTVRMRREVRKKQVEAGDILGAHPVAARIAEAVRTLGEAPISAIAKEAGTCRQTALKWLRRLAETQVVEKSRDANGPVSALYRARAA